MITTIPPFVLKKIFRKGCAYVTQDGFSITVVNAISPMRITKPSAENLERLTIKLDEEKLNLKDFFIHYKDIVAPYIDLTPLKVFFLISTILVR